MPRDSNDDFGDMPDFDIPIDAYDAEWIEQAEPVGADPMAKAAGEIARAAALNPIDYDRQRKEIANRLGISVETLDREVTDARRAAGMRGAAGAKMRVQDVKNPDDVLAYFNARHSVVFEAGKAVVFQSRTDEILNRHVFDRISFSDLKNFYCNRTIEIPNEDPTKPPSCAPIAGMWLKSTRRTEYAGGVVFDPTEQCGVDYLNLWRGFAVEPKPGSWALMKDHIRRVICKDDQIKFNYLIGWMARLVQYPAQRGEVAVVIRGKEGTGKGTLANAIKRIFGQHGIAISNAKHLTGNFNAHLQDCVFLFADEALFAGDRSHIGVLKSIITEPTVTIEGKHKNAVEVPNYLHLMMASNETWVVPAGLDARRFFVLETSSDRIKDFAYFAAIATEMKSGGYEAMLHDLLNYDLSAFDVRDVPKTAELGEQKKLSLPTAESWWVDVLHRGYVWSSEVGLDSIFGRWTETSSTELLFKSYTKYAARAREWHPMSRDTFGRWLVGVGLEARRLSRAETGEEIANGISRAIIKARPMGYHLGTLEQARAAFEAATKLSFDWPGIEE